MSSPPAASDIALIRQQQRATSLAQRNLQKKATIATWTAALHDQLLRQWPRPPGQIIGFCWPIENEPDLRPLLAKWSVEAATVSALPVVIDRQRPLAFRRWQSGAEMVTDRYGIPTPAAGDFIQPDVLLIPLNAFDGNGFRIGYGGGFFDRTLATLTPRPLAIGVGYEIGRIVDTLPQPHDQPMDWIVTEAGAWKI